MMLEPDDLLRIIDYAHEFSQKSSVATNPKIYLADSIGYYNLKEISIKEKVLGEEDAIWPGCGAGKSGFGILHNGDIVPCTSLRNENCIQGNIRDTRLIDIWNGGFKQFREFSASQLKGFCSDCMYSSICLGGCANTRYCVEGCIESENKYCLYGVMVKKELNKLLRADNDYKLADIKRQISDCIKSDNYQLLIAYIYEILPRYLSGTEIWIYLMNTLAFSYFKIELFEKTLEVCQQVLKNDSTNLDALKGYGLSLYHTGETTTGKQILFDCINNSKNSCSDIYSDLVNIMRIEGNESEAARLIAEASKKYPDFLMKRGY